MDKYINLAIIAILCISLGIKDKFESENIYEGVIIKSKQIIDEYNILKKTNNLKLIKHIIVIIICSVLFISIVFINSSFVFYSVNLVIYILIAYLNSFNYELYLFNDKIKFIIKDNQDYVEKTSIT
ncbi:hypothetical protein KHQ81_11660 [Mycoplasmatota bacterium]|nr:hypothetical protein KHQ81_11660 [Mycoplasmatota bacterium]